MALKQRSFRSDKTNFDGGRIVLRRRYRSLGLAGIADYVTSTAELLRPDPGRKEGRRRWWRQASWRRRQTSRWWWQASRRARTCTSRRARTCASWSWAWTCASWSWARRCASRSRTWRALVAWSLVRLWRRLVLAVDSHWLCLDLRLLSLGQRESVGFGPRPRSATISSGCCRSLSGAKGPGIPPELLGQVFEPFF